MGWLPVIFLIIVGLAVLAGLRFPEGKLHPVGVLALSFWTGVISITFVLTLVAIVTGYWVFEIFWICLIAAVGVLIWKHKKAKPLICIRCYYSMCPNKPDKHNVWLIIALVPFVIFATWNIYLLTSIATSYPLVAFDTLGNFGIKAKLWYHTRLLFPEQLTNPDYLMYKRTYPPIVPVMESLWSYIFSPSRAGEWDGLRVKWFFVSCWLSCGMLIFALVHRRAGALAGIMGACYWFALPVNMLYVYGGAIDGYADVPLAMSFVAAVAAIYVLSNENNFRQMILLGLMLAGAFWLKKEGLPFIAACFAWMVLRRAGWRTLATAAGICAIFFVIDMLASRGLPTTFEDDMGFDHVWTKIKMRMSLLPGIFKDELEHKIRWGEKIWLLLGLVWIYKFVRIPWKRWFTPEFFLFLFMVFVYCVVTLITYYSFPQNTDRVFERLFLHIFPLLIAATFNGFIFGPKEAEENLDWSVAGKNEPELNTDSDLQQTT